MHKASALAILTAAGFLAGQPASASNWMAQIGGLGPEIVFDVVETVDQRLCATGTFTNEAEFGAGDLTTVLAADGIQDIYVACFSHDGELAFAVQFGAGIGDEPRALAALPDGDILVTGYFSRSFGAGKRASIAAGGAADIFLTRLDTRGEEVWSRKFGGKFADNGSALAVTPEGDVLLGGNFQDVITYEEAGKTRKISSAGGRDAFVFKLDEQGAIRWAQRFGGAGRDETSRVLAGADGSVVMAGTFERQARLADGTHAMRARGGADAFILSFDADGGVAWSEQVGGPNREYVSGLGRDGNGRLLLAGNFLNELPLPDGSRLQSAGSTDVFLIGFGADGSQRWARRFGGEQVDESFDLAVTPDDRLLLAGHFQGDMAFAASDGRKVLQSSGIGNADGFVLELDADGRDQNATIAAGSGVETVFAVTGLQGGGTAAAGFFNRQLDIALDGLPPFTKRGKTDVFLLRTADSRPSAATSADR